MSTEKRDNKFRLLFGGEAIIAVSREQFGRMQTVGRLGLQPGALLAIRGQVEYPALEDEPGDDYYLTGPKERALFINPMYVQFIAPPLDDAQPTDPAEHNGEVISTQDGAGNEVLSEGN